MLQRLNDMREPLGEILINLSTDLVAITAEEYEAIYLGLGVLEPVHQATVEFSEEKSVAGSNALLRHEIGANWQMLQPWRCHGFSLACSVTVHPVPRVFCVSLGVGLSVLVWSLPPGSWFPTQPCLVPITQLLSVVITLASVCLLPVSFCAFICLFWFSLV